MFELNHNSVYLLFCFMASTQRWIVPCQGQNNNTLKNCKKIKRRYLEEGYIETRDNIHCFLHNVDKAGEWIVLYGPISVLQ